MHTAILTLILYSGLNKYSPILAPQVTAYPTIAECYDAKQRIQNNTKIKPYILDLRCTKQ